MGDHSWQDCPHGKRLADLIATVEEAAGKAEEVATRQAIVYQTIGLAKDGSANGAGKQSVIGRMDTMEVVVGEIKALMLEQRVVREEREKAEARKEKEEIARERKRSRIAWALGIAVGTMTLFGAVQQLWIRMTVNAIATQIQKSQPSTLPTGSP